MWGATVCTVIVRRVWSARMFFSTGVAVMGSVGVTTLHHLGTGDLELSPPPPAPEVVPSCNALILEKNRIL
jgi:hypothetical protein